MSTKKKDLIGIPWLLAFALRADGWWLRDEIVWAKPSPKPESVRDRCTSAHEKVFLLSKSAAYFFDAAAIREAAVWDRAAPGDTRHPRNVWNIASQNFSGAHFATMPPALAERCLLAGSTTGDVVLDPFLGAGTTALAANRIGRLAVGCELSGDYVSLARARLSQAGYESEVY